MLGIWVRVLFSLCRKYVEKNTINLWLKTLRTFRWSTHSGPWWGRAFWLHWQLSETERNSLFCKISQSQVFSYDHMWAFLKLRVAPIAESKVWVGNLFFVCLFSFYPWIHICGLFRGIKGCQFRYVCRYLTPTLIKKKQINDLDYIRFEGL